MLKFNSSVITSSTGEVTRIITLDHDDLITVSGKLTKCIPLLAAGTTMEKLVQELGAENSKQITEFITLLTRAGLLETDLESNHQYSLGDHQFDGLGKVNIETIEVQETYGIIGIKGVREICGA
ncbi:MAG: hypothetical protein ACJ76H_05940 [Bacteriovoracaceae bacterium]